MADKTINYSSGFNGFVGIHCSLEELLSPEKAQFLAFLKRVKPHIMICDGAVKKSQTKEQLKKLINFIKVNVLEEHERLFAIDCESKNINRLSKLDDADVLPLTAPEMAEACISYVIQIAQDLRDLLKYLGINMVFSPCLDLDLGCPVISDTQRSFSKDPMTAYSTAVIICRILEAAGIRTVTKHFPGHGGADKDTHLEKAFNNPATFDLELEPFKMSLDEGTTKAYMFSHVIYSNIDNDTPASISPKVHKLFEEIAQGDEIRIGDSVHMKGGLNGLTFKQHAKKFFKAGGHIMIIDKPDRFESQFGISISAAFDFIESLYNERKLAVNHMEFKKSEIMSYMVIQ